MLKVLIKMLPSRNSIWNHNFILAVWVYVSAIYTHWYMRMAKGGGGGAQLEYLGRITVLPISRSK